MQGAALFELGIIRRAEDGGARMSSSTTCPSGSLAGGSFRPAGS